MLRDAYRQGYPKFNGFLPGENGPSSYLIYSDFEINKDGKPYLRVRVDDPYSNTFHEERKEYREGYGLVAEFQHGKTPSEDIHIRNYAEMVTGESRYPGAERFFRTFDSFCSSDIRKFEESSDASLKLSRGEMKKRLKRLVGDLSEYLDVPSSPYVKVADIKDVFDYIFQRKEMNHIIDRCLCNPASIDDETRSRFNLYESNVNEYRNSSLIDSLSRFRSHKYAMGRIFDICMKYDKAVNAVYDAVEMSRLDGYDRKSIISMAHALSPEVSSDMLSKFLDSVDSRILHDVDSGIKKGEDLNTISRCNDNDLDIFLNRRIKYQKTKELYESLCEKFSGKSPDFICQQLGSSCVLNGLSPADVFVLHFDGNKNSQWRSFLDGYDKTVFEHINGSYSSVSSLTSYSDSDVRAIPNTFIYLREEGDISMASTLAQQLNLDFSLSSDITNIVKRSPLLKQENKLGLDAIKRGYNNLFEKASLAAEYFCRQERESCRREKDKVLELVTAIPNTDKEFLAAANENYPEAKVVHVPSYQKTIELELDRSMEEYNMKKDAILENLSRLLKVVDTRRENENIPFGEIKVNGYSVNGISYHNGLDHSKYYLLSAEGQQFPGMQSYRLEEFFSNISPEQQDGVITGLKEAVKNLEVVRKEVKTQNKM